MNRNPYRDPAEHEPEYDGDCPCGTTDACTRGECQCQITSVDTHGYYCPESDGGERGCLTHRCRV